MGRRALLAASMAKGGSGDNESATFEFPLFLTAEMVFESESYVFYSRPNDSIIQQLFNWAIENATEIYEDYFITTLYVPSEIVNQCAIYVNGWRVTAIYCEYEREMFNSIYFVLEPVGEFNNVVGYMTSVDGSFDLEMQKL